MSFIKIWQVLNKIDQRNFQTAFLTATQILIWTAIVTFSLIGSCLNLVVSAEEQNPENLNVENSNVETLNPEDVNIETLNTENLSDETSNPEDENPKDPCQNPATNSDDCPVPQRLRPTFSEEDRGLSERGFQNSFLGEALSGSPDPFGGGSIGGNLDQQPNLPDITPVDRGLDPGFDTNFDPTNVIIPIDQIDSTTCCNS